MTGTEQVFGMLSETTKKKFNLKEPHDLDRFNLNTILSLEMVEQLREFNTNLSAIHDELWELNQRRDDL